MKTLFAAVSAGAMVAALGGGIGYGCQARHRPVPVDPIEERAPMDVDTWELAGDAEMGVVSEDFVAVDPTPDPDGESETETGEDDEDVTDESRYETYDYANEEDVEPVGPEDGDEDEEPIVEEPEERASDDELPY